MTLPKPLPEREQLMFAVRRVVDQLRDASNACQTPVFAVL